MCGKCPGVVEQEQAVLVYYSTMVGSSCVSSLSVRLERASRETRVSIVLRTVSGDGGRGGRVRPAAALVQAVALSAQQDEPVDLRRHDARVAQVGGQRQVEGHAVQGDAVVAAVHPVHEGEEGDAAHKEGEQYHAAVGLVQPAVLEAELEERDQRREGWREDGCG